MTLNLVYCHLNIKIIFSLNFYSFLEDTTKPGFEEKNLTEYIYLLGKTNVLMVIRQQVSMVSNVMKAII